MDRKEFYYGQIVDDDGSSDGLNVVFDDVENAIDSIVTDFEIYGVVSGINPTEHTPNNFTVDISTGYAYDKAGKRCYVNSSQNVDLSGFSLPAVGNEKYISIQLKFEQSDSDAWTDDLGGNGYWSHAEGFTIETVEGTEAAIPATRPSLPTTNILVCDVKLTNGMANITNTDILTDRKEFAVWPSDRLTIDSSGFSVLSATTETVQEFAEDVDGAIIDLDSSGYVEQDILPDAAGTRKLGDSGNEWDATLDDATVDDLTVKTKIAADSDRNDIGDSSKRFDVFAYDLSIYNSIISGITPGPDVATSATPMGEGNFDSFNSCSSGTSPDSSFTFHNTKEVDKCIPLSSTGISSTTNSGLTSDWHYYDANLIDGVTYEMWFCPNGDAGEYLIFGLDLPNGIKITDFEIVWNQSGAMTTDMTATLQKIARAAPAVTDIDDLTISGTGSWQKDTLTLSSSETVDNSAYTYRMEIRAGIDGASTANCAVSGITFSLSFSDLGKAII